MKKLVYSIAFFLLIAVSAQAQKGEEILGRWLDESGDGQVEITKKGDSYFGKLVWIRDVDVNGINKLDAKNPDEALRSRPLKHLEILKHLKFEKENKWVGGTIYDPKTGKTYKCSASIKNNNLVLRGFIGISLIGRNATFTRVK